MDLGKWQHWGYAAVGAYAGYRGLRAVVSFVRRRRAAALAPATFCIVITGSSHGLGLALARSFLSASRGNVRVVLNGRTQSDVQAAVAKLREDFSGLVRQDNHCISGCAGDVRNAAHMQALAQHAVTTMGAITHWINNAGITQSQRQALCDVPAEEVEAVIGVNLTGTLLATRAAIQAMREANCRGHVFLMEGMGSRQDASPLSVAYGASKAALPQLCKSLVSETKALGIGCHRISPGMIITRLLLRHATNNRVRFIFEVLADLPHEVAGELAPQILATYGTGSYITYLTPARALGRLLSFWLYRGRFFDEQGNCRVRVE